MTLQEILMLVNTPILGAAFLWIVRVEKRLVKIETVCKLRCDRENEE